MENSIYIPFKSIKTDKFEVDKLIYDENGTKIIIKGEHFSYEVIFGAIGSIHICDEGTRIRSYNEILEIQEYRKSGFEGNPIYEIKGNTQYKSFIENESCGFSSSMNLYVIITINHFIEILSPFPPEIIEM